MEYLHIGKLGRRFGLNAHIRIGLFPGMESVWEKILEHHTAVFIGVEDFKIPFFIEEYNDEKNLIKFKKVISDEAINEINGQALYVELTEEINEQYFDVQAFQNLTLIDFESKEVLGSIVRIEEFPSQTMAIVRRGEKEIMIPLVEAWVRATDIEGASVTMELPDGLIDPI